MQRTCGDSFFTIKAMQNCLNHLRIAAVIITMKQVTYFTYDYKSKQRNKNTAVQRRTNLRQLTSCCGDDIVTSSACDDVTLSWREMQTSLRLTANQRTRSSSQLLHPRNPVHTAISTTGLN